MIKHFLFYVLLALPFCCIGQQSDYIDYESQEKAVAIMDETGSDTTLTQEWQDHESTVRETDDEYESYDNALAYKVNGSQGFASISKSAEPAAHSSSKTTTQKNDDNSLWNDYNDNSDEYEASSYQDLEFQTGDGSVYSVQGGAQVSGHNVMVNEQNDMAQELDSDESDDDPWLEGLGKESTTDKTVGNNRLRKK